MALSFQVRLAWDKHLYSFKTVQLISRLATDNTMGIFLFNIGFMGFVHEIGGRDRLGSRVADDIVRDGRFIIFLRQSLKEFRLSGNRSSLRLGRRMRMGGIPDRPRPPDVRTFRAGRIEWNASS